MTDKKALQSTVHLLRSGIWDGKHLVICQNYAPECDGCPCHTGVTDGHCCRGLFMAADRHLTMFHRGGCDFKAAQKRMDTLADYLETVIERLKS